MIFKRCAKCQLRLPLSEFPKDRSRPDGVYSYCRLCNYNNARSHAVKNPAKTKAYQQKYQAEHKAKKVEYQQRYYKKLRTTDEGVEQIRNICRTRRARKRGNTVNLPTQSQILARIAECNNQCVYCGAPYSHLDHAIPVVLGGGDDLWNLLPTCATCNLSKGPKSWDVWYPKQSFYDPDRALAILILLTPA